MQARLLALAGSPSDGVALPVLGAPEAALEAALGRLVPPGGGLLLLDNAGSCQHAVHAARALRLPHVVEPLGAHRPADPSAVGRRLRALGASITHLVFVHHDLRTGLVNPFSALAQVARDCGVTSVVDASASFGGVPVRVGVGGADVAVVHGDGPLGARGGLSWVLTRSRLLAGARTFTAPSVYLDLVAQADHLERTGRPRFAIPFELLRSIARALDALDEQGGVEARMAGRAQSFAELRRGFTRAGLAPLLAQRDEGGLQLVVAAPPGAIDAVVASPIGRWWQARRQEGGFGVALAIGVPHDASDDDVAALLHLVGNRARNIRDGAVADDRDEGFGVG